MNEFLWKNHLGKRGWFILIAAICLLAAGMFFQANDAFAAPDPEVTDIEIVSSHDLFGIQEVVATIYFDEGIEFAVGATYADLAAELDMDINITNITTNPANAMAFEITSVSDNYLVIRVYETGNGMFNIRGADMSVRTKNGSGLLNSLVAKDSGAKAMLLNTDFKDLIIDTGMELITLSSTTGTAFANPKIEGQIIAPARVRGIAWFQLLNNGVVQEYGYDPVADDYLYEWPISMMEGGSPLHTHNYLTLEADDYVAALEEAINGDDNMSIDYELVIDGTDPTKFTIEKISGGIDESLSMRIFNHQMPGSNRAPPAAPTDLMIINHTASSALISWAGSDNVGVTGYYIYINGNYVSYVNSNVTTYNAKGLSAGASYTFTVKANNGKEASQASNPVVFVPQTAAPHAAAYHYDPRGRLFEIDASSAGTITVDADANGNIIHVSAPE